MIKVHNSKDKTILEVKLDSSQKDAISGKKGGGFKKFLIGLIILAVALVGSVGAGYILSVLF